MDEAGPSTGPTSYGHDATQNDFTRPTVRRTTSERGIEEPSSSSGYVKFLPSVSYKCGRALSQFGTLPIQLSTNSAPL